MTNKVINKRTTKRVVREKGLGGLGGLVGEGRVGGRILKVVEQHKHLMNPESFHILSSNLTDDIQFVHFLIFAILFFQSFQFIPRDMDFHAAFAHFTHIPFHSFLLHLFLSHADKNL